MVVGRTRADNYRIRQWLDPGLHSYHYQTHHRIYCIFFIFVSLGFLHSIRRRGVRRGLLMVVDEVNSALWRPAHRPLPIFQPSVAINHSSKPPQHPKTPKHFPRSSSTKLPNPPRSTSNFLCSSLLVHVFSLLHLTHAFSDTPYGMGATQGGSC